MAKTYRILYDENEVIAVVENNNSFTYTPHKVFVGDLIEAEEYLNGKSIDTSKIVDLRLNGEVLPELDLYPYANEGRNIRVELTDAQVTGIVLNSQTRPLMEWAYHVPNQKTDNGIVLWFIDFANDLMSEAETEGLLLSLGAVITRKTA
jgi:hypothetical protein